VQSCCTYQQGPDIKQPPAIWAQLLEAAVAQALHCDAKDADPAHHHQPQRDQPQQHAVILSHIPQALDPDVLVGHNIGAFDLTVLLTRMQHHKV
jgi:hypothetical protein